MIFSQTPLLRFEPVGMTIAWHGVPSARVAGGQESWLQFCQWVAGWLFLRKICFDKHLGFLLYVIGGIGTQFARISGE